MGNPIRVLCVFSCLDRGGAETMFMNLYRKIDRKRVQFDFVKHTQATGDYEEEIIALGGRIFTAPKLRISNYVEYRKWWKKHLKEHAEHKTIHIHFFTITAAIAPIAHRYNCYVIGHCHTSYDTTSFRLFIHRSIIRLGGKCVDFAFACSSAAGTFMYGKKDYFVLNNAIDTDRFKHSQNNRDKLKRELGLKGKTVIGHVGRFCYEKNHCFLIDVFAQVNKRIHNCKLMLVGDGPLRDEVENHAKEIGVFEDIIFMGVRSDVNNLMQTMDFFVFPSFYEGLGVVLVEAQASGLPCIISDTVSKEAILIDDLVTQKSLDESAKDWADSIISNMGYMRCSRAEDVKAKGYDVQETAKWLEEFYLNH